MKLDTTFVASRPAVPTRSRRRWALATTFILLLSACSDTSGAGEGDDVDTGEPGETDEPAAAGWTTLGYDPANTRAVTDDSDLNPDTVTDLAPRWELDGIHGFSSTPLVEDEIVYAGDWAGDVHAIEASSGEVQWSTPLDGDRVQASVALDDERVFAGTFDATFAALDRDSGDILWETRLDDHEFASMMAAPVHVDGLVIVGVASFENMIRPGADATFRGSVVAFDAETGEEEWRYWTTAGDDEEGPGVGVWTTPAIDPERGHLYIGTGQHYGEPTAGRSDAVISLDIATGEEQWVHQFTEGDTWTASEGGLDADVSASPTLFEIDGRAVVGSGDKRGSYRALDRDTGEEVWARELTEGSPQGGVMSGAAFAGEELYVLSNEEGQVGSLFALDAATGETIWSEELGGAAMGPVTWANGVVFVADNSATLSAFAAEDGERLWAHTVGEQSATGFSVVDGSVYAGYGWWLVSAPEDPIGGLIAFDLDGAPDAADETDDAADETEAAADETEAAGADGATLFSRSCASCHGSDGSGANGPSLIDVGDRLGPDERRTMILEGRGAMAGWEGRLDDEEVNALVDFLGEL